MPFQYNPHNLVKIWLSKDPSVFMNFENQTRLIDMRLNNPTANISLIYDSTLLNEQAQTELQQFCDDNGLVAVDADKFELDDLSQEEKELYGFYKDEIEHINEGGNLGVASDILRVLTPTCRLGTYTDVDAPVYSNYLPETVDVNSPLLLNISSLKLFGSKEVIYAVNELVAVVDEEQAKPYLQKIHRGMLKQLKEFNTDILDKSIHDFTSNSYLQNKLRSIVENRPDASYIQKSNLLTPTDGIRTSRNLRTYIFDVTSDAKKYIDFQRREEESDQDVVQRLRNEMKANNGISQWLFARGQYNNCKEMLALDDEQFIEAHMKRERSLYLLFIVLCTTGPLEITNSLFNSCVLTSEQIDEMAVPHAYQDNGLEKAFATSIKIPLHATLGKVLHLLNNNVGVFSDASWLKEGRNLIKQREVILRQRQAELTNTLGDELATAKNNIELCLEALQKRQNSWLGWFFHNRRALEIQALTETLNCFESDHNTFDIQAFYKVSDNIAIDDSGLLARWFPSQALKHIKELKQLSKEAVILSVTKDKKPTFNAVNSVSSALAKLTDSEQLAKRESHGSQLVSSSDIMTQTAKLDKDASHKGCCFGWAKSETSSQDISSTSFQP